MISIPQGSRKLSITSGSEWTSSPLSKPNFKVNFQCCRDKESFEKKGLDEDVIKLRYKHFMNRLLDAINRVLEERQEVKKEMQRLELRNRPNPDSNLNSGANSPAKTVRDGKPSSP